MDIKLWYSVDLLCNTDLYEMLYFSKSVSIGWSVSSFWGVASLP